MGIIAKLLERGIKALIKKECKNIGTLKVDINASSIQIIKGMIQKIKIIADNINYKDLLFDEIELETNEVKMTFNFDNKEINFNNNLTIQLRISLSNNSIAKMLLSDNFSWIRNIISNEFLNREELEVIKIRNDLIIVKSFKDKNTFHEEKNLNIKAKEGKIYLEDRVYNKSIRIPLEDKIVIRDVNIKNNIIIISANSSISF